MATETAARDQSRGRKPATGLWRDAFGRLRKNQLAMVGLVSVLFLFFIAIIGPYIAPYPYHASRTSQAVVAERRPAAAAAEPGPHPRHRPDRPRPAQPAAWTARGSA